MQPTLYTMTILLAAAMPAQADDAAYWRISSAHTTVVTSIDINGVLTWSQGAEGDEIQIHRATSISGATRWHDYIRVTSTGASTSVRAFEVHPPKNMILIPAGHFVMGNATNVLPADEGFTSELPQHTVFVSAFHMDQYEVTKDLWDGVRAWGIDHGYSDLALGSWYYDTNHSKGTNHPVHSVAWIDCVKWCNARSEMEGLTPCYTTNSITYRTGTNNNVACDWQASGYRLPTEAEWEKAARGGSSGHRFPWSDSETIEHLRANYHNSPLTYDTSATTGYHPTFATGDYPWTSPVGYFPPNGYGLYDMAGNVGEWCWDQYSSSYYASSPSTDPRGLGSGTDRVVRYGSWVADAYGSRVSQRSGVSGLGSNANGLGFRTVRSGSQ